MSLAVDTSSTFEKVIGKLQRYKTYHLLFWILYAAFWSFTFVASSNLFSAFGTSILRLFFHALVAYFNNYYLIEKYLLKRDYGAYLLSLLLSIALAFFPIVLIYYTVVLEDSSASQQVWSWRFFLVNRDLN